MDTVAVLNRTHRTRRGSGDESTRAHDQSESQRRAGNGPPCQMTPHWRIFARESPYSSLEEIAALESYGCRNGLLSPSGEAEDGGGKHERLTSCCCVIG